MLVSLRENCDDYLEKISSMEPIDILIEITRDLKTFDEADNDLNLRKEFPGGYIYSSFLTYIW